MRQHSVGNGTDYIKSRAALTYPVTVTDVKAEAKKLLSTDPTVMIVRPPR
ncbi:hypothetical protein [Mesorhizobium sp. ORS 3428]|nr:hypothetical protein [Mesorhizobium sp. ORS 3428]